MLWMLPVLLQVLLAQQRNDRFRERCKRWEVEQGMHWDGKSFKHKVAGLRQGRAKLGPCILRMTAQTELPVFTADLPDNPGVSLAPSPSATGQLATLPPLQASICFVMCPSETPESVVLPS